MTLPKVISYKNSQHRILLLFLIAVAYFVLARVSLLLSFQTSNATPVWPPSGLAFALMLLYGYKIAPAILAGAFAVNVVVFQANHAAGIFPTIWVSCLIGIGNMAEALAGWWLIRKIVPGVRDNNYFNKVNPIFRFLLV